MRELNELNEGLDRIEEAVDNCIENLNEVAEVDENIYVCCLCHRDIEADDLDDGFDVDMCSRCARELDHYGCE